MPDLFSNPGIMRNNFLCEMRATLEPCALQLLHRDQSATGHSERSLASSGAGWLHASATSRTHRTRAQRPAQLAAELHHLIHKY
jgi:hypothetical protein